MKYDGFFAEQEERVGVGGSLSLSSHMCSELGLEKGSIIVIGMKTSVENNSGIRPCNAI